MDPCCTEGKKQNVMVKISDASASPCLPRPLPSCPPLPPPRRPHTRRETNVPSATTVSHSLTFNRALIPSPPRPPPHTTTTPASDEKPPSPHPSLGHGRCSSFPCFFVLDLGASPCPCHPPPLGGYQRTPLLKAWNYRHHHCGRGHQRGGKRNDGKGRRGGRRVGCVGGICT